MKRLSPQSSRRGVALVITLIMLSVVTITAARTLALARMASSRFTVPITLVLKVSAGCAYEVRTKG